MIKSYILTIVTINFNNSKGLEATLISIVNQSYNDFEYVVIDGCSNDGSRRILDNYHSKISKCIIEKDDGIYFAMNKGIVNASGEYILFLNSGDILANNNVIQNLINELDGTDIIACDFSYNYGNMNVSSFPLIMSDEFILKNTLGHPSTFVKASILKKNNFDTSLKIVSDWKLFTELLVLKRCSYKKVNLILSIVEKPGVSSNYKLRLSERLKVLQELYPNYLILFEAEKRISYLKKSKIIRLLKLLGLFKYI